MALVEDPPTEAKPQISAFCTAIVDVTITLPIVPLSWATDEEYAMLVLPEPGVESQLSMVALLPEKVILFLATSPLENLERLLSSTSTHFSIADPEFKLRTAFATSVGAEPLPA